MLIILFAILLVVGVILLFSALDAFTKIGFLFRLIASILSFILSVTSFVSIFVLDKMIYEEKVQTKDYQLVCLQDNSQISGNIDKGIFYVHASIGEDETYTFYYKIDNGFKMEKISAKNTIIYEQDDVSPHIIQYATNPRSKLPNEMVHNALTCFKYFAEEEKSYEIYVPRGTIVTEYKLDAK